MTRLNKTMVLATAFFALIAASVDATASGIVGKGLKVGLNSATMSGTGADPGLTPQTGVVAGAFVTLGLTERLSVQSEVLYTEKGAECESGARPYEYRFSYIEVPVLWKLTIADRGATFRPNVYAGGFVGFKTGAQIETYRDRDQEEADEATFPSARGIDAGYAVGVGADLSLGPGRALVDVRYGRSLVSAVTTGANVTHRVVSVFLGYAFD
jgi:hypothetical protein